MAKHNDTGTWGEEIACEHLISLGYAIVERNWRMGHLEIDIIASRGQKLVVAEVKTRSDKDEDPFEAVDNRKIGNIVRAAEAYVKFTDTPLEVQFDLFGISGKPDDYILEHIPNAFEPSLRTYR